MGIILKGKNKKYFIVPKHITLLCNGKEGDYVTDNHLILCKYRECGKGKSTSLFKWDRNAGTRVNKWNQHVEVIFYKQNIIG